MGNWHAVIRSYPCLECGAGPGEYCHTKTGNKKNEPHAIRTQGTDHCPKCGDRTPADIDPGEICDRCKLVRRLEIERATHYRRRY